MLDTSGTGIESLVEGLGQAQQGGELVNLVGSLRECQVMQPSKVRFMRKNFVPLNSYVTWQVPVGCATARQAQQRSQAQMEGEGSQL